MAEYLEIQQLVWQWISKSEIARHLGIDRETVRKHLREVEMVHHYLRSDLTSRAGSTQSGELRFVGKFW